MKTGTGPVPTRPSRDGRSFFIMAYTYVIYSAILDRYYIGHTLDSTAILETLKMIQERLKTVSWTIKIETKE